jgi:integrase
MPHPHLTTRGPAHQLYFRRAIPPPLRAAAGRREIWLSLQTTCRATALARLRKAEAYFDQCIAEAMASLGHPKPSDDWLPPGLATATAPPPETGCMPTTAKAMPEAEGRLAAAHAPAGQPWRAPCRATAAAVLDGDSRRTRRQGSATRPALPTRGDPDDSWEAALALWRAERTPARKTANEVARQITRFQSVVGPLPLSHLSAAHIEQFKAHCQQAGLSLSRINTILSLLSRLVRLAMQKGLTALAKSPFAGAKYGAKAVHKTAATVRDAFTAAELNALFGSPVYLQGHRPAKGGGEAAYWIPLLGLFTGARLEDLCRIDIADVVRREGAWCTRLHDTKREHRLGRPSLLRYVPLHAGLRRCGFLSFVATARAARGAGPLFPDLHTNQYGQRSAAFSSWFNPYLDTIGLADPRMVFHSLRHTFKALGELAGSDAALEELMGHASDDRYGRREDGERRLPFARLVAAMARLRFPGLQIGHLYRDGPSPVATPRAGRRHEH